MKPKKDAIGINNCGTCAFFHCPGPTDLVGACIRFPPTPFIMGYAQPSPLVNPTKAQPAQPIVHAFYPVVEAASGCGEHQPVQTIHKLSS